MSKERSLLTKAVDKLRFTCGLCGIAQDEKLIHEINEYLAQPKPQPLTESEIITLGFKAGFYIDHVKNEETGQSDYGFVDDEGQIMNDNFIKFARLIENRGINETAT